jgi:hypothetical protein
MHFHWDYTWLDGQASRDLAPNLYKLAWCKHLHVREKLQGDNWTRGLRKMSTAVEKAEFVLLWSVVQVQLTDRPDEITWKWTMDGAYYCNTLKFHH